MMITSDNLKNPPKKYRPMPFWSWNNKLDIDETLFQVNEMNNCGMGGFFMHARGGLKTPYMEKGWMENICASVDEAEKNGMYAWGYDENGWPSGFGNDAVNGLGAEYHQKSLRMEITDIPKYTETTIANITSPDGKNAHFYYAVNDQYVDNLNPKVTEAFIKSTHEKYKETLGDKFKNMAGFFTDEPQLSRKGAPWSLVLPEAYRKEYGEDLVCRLCDLFFETETCYKTRFRFWRLVTKMFSENYMKKLYDWCNENGVSLTGHMVAEDFMKSQVDGNGACMPNYEYLHIPGVDRLSRWVEHNVAVIQASSVASQLGKKQVLTESYAMAGWDVSFEELKWQYEWQMVKGANFLCQHLAPYSLEGIRKRDYPSGHFYQNPWWSEYSDFNDFAGRMGMLLSEGEIKCDVLILQPMSTAWVARCGDDFRSNIALYDEKLLSVMNCLDQNQILYHLGDDTIMRKYGKVDGENLWVGKISYSTVIVPASKNLDSNTFELLKAFSDNGGNLIFVDEIPQYIDGVTNEKIIELAKNHVKLACEILPLIPENQKSCSVKNNDGKNLDIQYTYRKFDDFEMYYFVNSHAGRCENSVISLNGESIAQFDYMTGEVKPIEYTNEAGSIKVLHTFEEKGSLALFVYDDDRYKPCEREEAQKTCINNHLKGTWQICDHDPNILTLDFCDCYFDNELVAKNIYVNDIQEKANALKRKVNVKCVYKVQVNDVPCGNLYLVLEQADNYSMLINDKLCSKVKCGYYRDKSFTKLDITGKLLQGENTITLVCDFVQPKEVYEQIDNCGECETAKNKLWYDMEIEPVYLLGDFAVCFDKEFREVPDDCYINEGKISICKMPKFVNDGDLTTNGFAFFCGHMKLRKNIELNANEVDNAYIELSRRCSAVSRFTVNERVLDNMYFAPYVQNLNGNLSVGENIIELDIIGNFRNMLGPHHTIGEECYVAPSSFLHESKIFGCAKKWTDGYCFAKYGLFLK